METPSTHSNNDSWKDAFLTRPEISQAEFLALPDEQKLWLIAHKDVFYNLNGAPIINLLHPRNKGYIKIPPIKKNINDFLTRNHKNRSGRRPKTDQK